MFRVSSPAQSWGRNWRRGLAIPFSLGLGLLPMIVLALVLRPGVASASGVVTTCNNAGLTTALAGGGLVTFNCGSNPATITVSSQKVITLPTTIDGGALGRVILSGGNMTRVFSVQSGASLTLLNLVVRDGRDEPGGGGGAVNVANSQLALTNTSFISNSTTCCGGALFLAGGSSAIIASSTFAGNHSDQGAGAIYNSHGIPLSIADSSFHDNQAGYVGAIENYGSLTLARVSLFSNLGTDYAGALYTQGPASLVDVAIFSNTVIGPDGWGGGMDDEYSGAMTLNRVQIYSNHVISGYYHYSGGGLTVFYGALTLTDSSVYSNVADTGPGGGIHVSFSAVVNVVRSAIYGNRALAGAGGGIDLRSFAGVPALSIYNSTLSGNSATAGGGLSTDGNDPAYLSYTTFYSNSAAIGQDITGSVSLADSIIAGSGNANCVGLFKSLGHNLDDGNSCQLFASGDLTDSNPLLGPLAFNGGPTPTNALLAGSPAIDAADPVNCPPTDQRGSHRPVDGDSVIGAVCDIGAFELKPLLNSFLPLVRR